MIIDGKEINFYQTKKKTSERYNDLLIQHVRNGIRKIDRIYSVKPIISKSTDSIYLEVKMNNALKPIIISLRTHLPIDFRDSYIYFFIPNYYDVRDLIKDISEEVISTHNNFIKENYKNPNMLVSVKEFKGKINPNKKKSNRKKMKKSHNLSYYKIMEKLDSLKETDKVF